MADAAGCVPADRAEAETMSRAGTSFPDTTAAPIIPPSAAVRAYLRSFDIACIAVLDTGAVTITRDIGARMTGNDKPVAALADIAGQGWCGCSRPRATAAATTWSAAIRALRRNSEVNNIKQPRLEGGAVGKVTVACGSYRHRNRRRSPYPMQ
jgi:hypothetical protein